MAELQSVQAVPQGLLELLGMKGSGQNPRTLDSIIDGVVDVRQMYALQRLSSPSAGFTATFAELTVPATETWVLLTAQGVMRTTGATTTYAQGALYIGFGNGIGELAVATQKLELAAGGAMPSGLAATLPFCAPYPLVLRPGGTIGCREAARIGGAALEYAIQVNVGVLS